MPVDSATGFDLHRTMECVRCVEAKFLAELIDHRMLMYLWVCKESFHWGCCRQYAIASAILASRSRPSFGWRRKWLNASPSKEAGSTLAWGKTSLSSSPDVWT